MKLTIRQLSDLTNNVAFKQLLARVITQAYATLQKAIPSYPDDLTEENSQLYSTQLTNYQATIATLVKIESQIDSVIGTTKPLLTSFLLAAISTYDITDLTDADTVGDLMKKIASYDSDETNMLLLEATKLIKGYAFKPKQLPVNVA